MNNYVLNTVYARTKVELNLSLKAKSISLLLFKTKFDVMIEEIYSS